MKKISVFCVLLACWLSALAQVATVAPVRYLSGLEPDKFSSNKLNINPGSVAEFYGNALFHFPQETQINLQTTGMWGIDKAPVVDGKDLYVYVIANRQSGQFGLMASQAMFQGDVVLPAGFTVERKLPWGVMYRLEWDGIPNFHLTNWPMPDIRFTDSEYSQTWSALTAGTAPDWTIVDLSRWIPDNARMAYIQVETRWLPNQPAGSSYIRSYAGQASGLLVGSVNPGMQFSNGGSLKIRVDSTRKMEYKATPGAAIYIRVLGYSMTEPA